MTLRSARRLALAFFIAYVVVQTYPGALLFQGARPFVLGLPFSFFWAALWVALSLPVFWLLDRAEDRAARPAGSAAGGTATTTRAGAYSQAEQEE